MLRWTEDIYNLLNQQKSVIFLWRDQYNQSIHVYIHLRDRTLITLSLHPLLCSVTFFWLSFKPKVHLFTRTTWYSYPSRFQILWILLDSFLLFMIVCKVVLLQLSQTYCILYSFPQAISLDKVIVHKVDQIVVFINAVYDKFWCWTIRVKPAPLLLPKIECLVLNENTNKSKHEIM